MDKVWNDKQESVKLEQKNIELLKLNAQEIKKKMYEITDKYYADEDAYYAQQKDIRKIEWMTQQKERAIKYRQIQMEREAAERAKKPIHPFIEEMEICDQLIAFCKKFSVDKKQEENKATEKVQISEAIQNKINKGELKPVEDKRKKEEEKLVVGEMKKKKKGQKKDKKDNKKGVEAKLQVDFGTLMLFDKVQLAPPIYLKDLPAIVAKINEKKAYFKDLPEKEEQKEKAEPQLVPEKKEGPPAAQAEEKKEMEKVEEKKIEAPAPLPEQVPPAPQEAPAAPGEQPAQK